MKINLIKSYIRNVQLLTEEYEEYFPKSVEDEVNQIKTKRKSGYEITEYERDLLATTREIKRNSFRQLVHWSEEAYSEIDDSVGIFNIEDLDQNKFDIVAKELSEEEKDLLGLMWELLFKIETPREPIEKMVSYVSHASKIVA